MCQPPTTDSSWAAVPDQPSDTRSQATWGSWKRERRWDATQSGARSASISNGTLPHTRRSCGPEKMSNATHPRQPDCPFCPDGLKRRVIVGARTLAVATEDNYPINPGHTLVVPRRHVPHLGDLDENEWMALRGEVRAQQRRIRGTFTVGVNDREAAGQTVPHAHIHVIPRHHGDTPNPRSGVRKAVDGADRYWEQEQKAVS